MSNEKHLYILWTSGDFLTANFMVLQYATACITQDWWDKVTVIIWGASVKLAAEDENIQLRIKAAIHIGVEFTACVASARQLGAMQMLENLGVSNKGIGWELSTLIQENKYIITV